MVDTTKAPAAKPLIAVELTIEEAAAVVHLARGDEYALRAYEHLRTALAEKVARAAKAVVMRDLIATPPGPSIETAARAACGEAV